jgi:hypothetical protein|tara:strand:+ start:280 stop:561 length:282 start_codon:yes stop_codon:yes gene_type:complete
MLKKKGTMKNFRVQIRAYGYYASFEITSEDEDKAFENALVDKLGKNDIVWEKDGFIDHRKLWITYEEIIDANASKGPLQTEERSGDRVGGAAA